MVNAIIFDFDEAKALAEQYIDRSYEPERFKYMLTQLNSELDYVFEILEQDILAGDLFLKNVEPRVEHSDIEIYCLGNYRIPKIEDRFFKRLMIVKVLKID